MVVTLSCYPATREAETPLYLRQVFPSKMFYGQREERCYTGCESIPLC